MVTMVNRGIWFTWMDRLVWMDRADVDGQG